MKVEWKPSVLPGCFGYPCEQLRLGKHVARVWQASHITSPGAWCWSMDSGRVHVAAGHRGKAKAAARRALMALSSGTRPMSQPKNLQDASAIAGAPLVPTIMDSPTYRRLMPRLREVLGEAVLTEIEEQLNRLIAESR